VVEDLGRALARAHDHERVAALPLREALAHPLQELRRVEDPAPGADRDLGRQPGLPPVATTMVLARYSWTSPEPSLAHTWSRSTVPSGPGGAGWIDSTSTP